MRRRRITPLASIKAPASAIAPAGMPVRGSSAAAGAAAVDPVEAAGAVAAAGAEVVGVAAAGGVACFFFAFLGVAGAVSGSWYCSSPAPSACAVAGAAAIAAAAISIDTRLRYTRPLVADVPCEQTVTLPRCRISRASR
jgi:hypothetical protein